MKKRIILIAAVLTAVIVCAAAFANETAADLYDRTMGLLTGCSNVTMNAMAEFALDGQWFKTAEVTLKQDEDRTVRRLHLRSPRKDGTERENGYTIVTEGYNLFLMEEFTPGVYRAGTLNERSTLIRNSVESNQLIELGRALASQADALLGKDAVTKTAEGEYRISLGSGTPAVANAALSQAFRFAAKRYFNFDYDLYDAYGEYSTISNYMTTTQGILFCTRSVAIEKAEITVKIGESGFPEHAEGSISLNMETAEEGVRRLDITFKAEAGDFGSTMLKKFNPEEYGVTIAPDSYIPVEDGEEVLPAPEKNEALEDEMCLEAMDLWRFTGFNTVSTTSVSCEWTSGEYVVTLDGGDDGLAKTTHFSEDGTMYYMEVSPAEWEIVDANKDYDFEGGLDKETDEAAKAFFMRFLDDIRYEKRDLVRNLELSWTCRKNGSLYALYEDKEPVYAESGVAFLIRISPEMRIEAFYSISNG